MARLRFSNFGYLLTDDRLEGNDGGGLYRHYVIYEWPQSGYKVKLGNFIEN